MSRDDHNPNPQLGEISSALPVCQSCEGDLRAVTSVCDRCGWFDATLRIGSSLSVGAGDGPGRAAVVPPDILVGSAFSFRLSTLLLVTTAVAVLLAIGVQAPGLAVMMAVFGVPPLVRTAMVVRKRTLSGVGTDAMTRASLFAVSMLVTWTIVVVMIGACCLTFCFTCLGVMSTGNSSENWIFGVAGCVSLVVGIGFLCLFTPWIRSRWRRDTQIEQPRDPS